MLMALIHNHLEEEKNGKPLCRCILCFYSLAMNANEQLVFEYRSSSPLARYDDDRRERGGKCKNDYSTISSKTRVK